MLSKSSVQEIKLGNGTIKQLDTCGLKCPEPVMLLHNALNNVSPGDSLIMKATDPTTLRDVKNFCLHLGHQLVSQKEEVGVFAYHIRKKCKGGS